ncbi:MAG: hypothetical protein R3C02_11265 [Planctomycetaceae bacterium]
MSNEFRRRAGVDAWEDHGQRVLTSGCRFHLSMKIPLERIASVETFIAVEQDLQRLSRSHLLLDIAAEKSTYWILS